jgi:hypothetical protein
MVLVDKLNGRQQYLNKTRPNMVTIDKWLSQNTAL